MYMLVFLHLLLHVLLRGPADARGEGAGAGRVQHGALLRAGGRPRAAAAAASALPGAVLVLEVLGPRAEVVVLHVGAGEAGGGGRGPVAALVALEQVRRLGAGEFAAKSEQGRQFCQYQFTSRCMQSDQNIFGFRVSISHQDDIQYMRY